MFCSQTIPSHLLSSFVHTQPFPLWFQSSQRLKGGCDRLMEKPRQVSCSQSSCHVYAHFLFFVCINYKSEKVAGEYLVKRQNWCKGGTANLSQGRVLSERRGGTEIPYLTPRMLQPVWKTALINWLHCGMNLLFEAIVVRTVQHRVELGDTPDGLFQYAEMKLLSAARVGRCY